MYATPLLKKYVVFTFEPPYARLLILDVFQPNTCLLEPPFYSISDSRVNFGIKYYYRYYLNIGSVT